jgi:hypothetical protein
MYLYRLMRCAMDDNVDGISSRLTVERCFREHASVLDVVLAFRIATLGPRIHLEFTTKREVYIAGGSALIPFTSRVCRIISLSSFAISPGTWPPGRMESKYSIRVESLPRDLSSVSPPKQGGRYTTPGDRLVTKAVCSYGQILGA